ncbi:hypothetical protein J6O86_01950 [bacterium]|nr:hypothetical protein [bacterium]
MGKIEDLKKKEELMSDLDIKFENGAYYKDYYNEKEGPYCSCCFDFNDKLVRMHEICENDAKNNIYNYICPKCKTKILIE